MKLVRPSFKVNFFGLIEIEKPSLYFPCHLKGGVFFPHIKNIHSTRIQNMIESDEAILR